MSSSVDAEYLLELNKILSGGAVLDLNGVEGAANRPWTQSYGQEMFPSPYEKAGALFHAIASTQYFQDGNKRTAWIATEFLLLEMGIELKDLPDVNYETFALTVAAVEDWDAQKAAEWYQENTKSVVDKVDYAVISFEATMSDSAPGTWDGQHIGLAGLTVSPLPAKIVIACIFRIRWSHLDLGLKGSFTFRVEPVAESGLAAGMSLSGMEVIEYGPIVESNHVHHAGEAMPEIYSTPLGLVVHEEGMAMIVISTNGEDIASIPLRVTLPLEVPDSLGHDLSTRMR